MTEPAGLRERLERLAQRGDDPGVERLIASVRRSLAEPDGAASSPAHRPGRRPLVAGAVAFAAVAAVVVAVIALGPRNHSSVPPATTPATEKPRPTPTTVTTTTPTVAPPIALNGTGAVSATDGQPAFVSAQEGWICAPTLRHTTNGGATWQTVSTPGTRQRSAPECAFAAGGHAWMTTYVSTPLPGSPVAAVVRVSTSTRVGSISVPLPGAGSNDTVVSLAFADARHGWAATLRANRPIDSTSTLYATTDGGVSWQRILSNAPVSAGLRFTSPAEGWGVSGRRLERTADGGRSWRSVPIVATPDFGREPFVGRLISVFPFGKRIVVDGFVPTGNYGEVFVEVSNDGGAHWRLQRVSTDTLEPAGTAPWQFVAVDADHWRAAAGGLAVTDDAGRTWHVRATAVPLSQVTGISFLTPDTGWALRCSDDICHGAVTTDAGRRWKLAGL